MAGGFGNGPGVGAPFAAGARANPGWQPTPNSEPQGSLTGAPPRTVLRSIPLVAGQATVLAAGTRENRILFVTPPSVGFTVFIGEAGVSTLNGVALPAGRTSEIPLVGLQDVYAVTNAPAGVILRVQLMISMILAAETERRY